MRCASKLIYRCDCLRPVSDSREYLYAHFVFASEDWLAAPTRVLVVTRAGIAASVELDGGGTAKVSDALLVNAGRGCLELGLALVGYGADGLVITTAPHLGERCMRRAMLRVARASELPPDVAQQIYAELERLRAVCSGARRPHSCPASARMA